MVFVWFVCILLYTVDDERVNTMPLVCIKPKLLRVPHQQRKSAFLATGIVRQSTRYFIAGYKA